MKKLLLFTFSVLISSSFYAQTGSSWRTASTNEVTKINKNVERETFPQDFKLFQVNTEAIRQTLFSAPNRLSSAKSNTIISLPNIDGKTERYEVFEFSNFEPALQAQYPDIRSYVGIGIDDKNAQVRLSIDPRGVQAMIFRTGKRNEFVEPYSQDGSVYAVYNSSRNKGNLPFTCSTQDNEIAQNINTQALRSSNAVLKTFRLALSCTAEYSNYFGATSAAQSGLVLAAYNATMTRVNGVYEIDLGIHLNITANSTSVIYYNASTDPYSNSTIGMDDHPTYNTNSNWNIELQNTLGSVIGVANYDIGHLFGADGGGGNAGCIGCVCEPVTTGSYVSNGVTYTFMNGKGMGFTSPGDGVPAGDNFDIDYVAHEMGHQFGGNHTFSHSTENSAVNIEPGSGSTIMAYAGITGATDVQAHSDDYFAYRSILQIQTNLLSKTCSVNTPITHGTPVVNAGADWTIPKQTPYKLDGSATDAGGGALTYCWEQNDDATSGFGGTGSIGAAGSVVSLTKTTGPNFRSRSPRTETYRYMPKMASILNNTLTADWESVSSIARVSNFTLTVRDNVAGGGQTNTDAMVVTVNASVGPFDVTSQNTDQLIWAPGSAQTITWTVNGTTALVGSANVDILLSTDNGQTFATTLASNVPNNGSYGIIVPTITATNCRVMVKPTGNIYFDVNSKNIAIGDVTYQSQNVCTDYPYTFNAAIPENAGQYSGYSLPIADSFTVTAVKVALSATHPNISTLQFGISSPTGYAVTPTSVISRLYRNASSCTSGVNLNKLFDMSGAAINCANTTDGAATIPFDDISTVNYVGTNSTGSWYIWFTDLNTTDGLTGTINNMTLTLCKSEFVPVLKNETFGLTDFALYPNPNNGNFTIQFSSESSNDVSVTVHDLRGRQVYTKAFQNNGLFNQELQLNNASSGIYLVTVQDGNKKEVKKIVVE